MNMTRGTIRFQLFGIPVFISPFSWVILALLGGGLHMTDSSDLSRILIFVVVGMVVLLTHEFGHALTGRALGGEPHAIVVEGLGAVTHSTPPRSRWGYFAMVLAGPLATLIPAIAMGFVLGLQIGVNPLASITYALLWPLPFVETPEWVQIAFLSASGPIGSDFMKLIYATTFQISVWWCLFNLLPILPLDGGHLLATLFPNRRVVCLTGMLLSIAMVIWAFTFGGIFLIMLFGYFGYINFQLLTRTE